MNDHVLIDKLCEKQDEAVAALEQVIAKQDEVILKLKAENANLVDLLQVANANLKVE